MKIPLHAQLLKKREGNGQHFHALNIDLAAERGRRYTWLPRHDSVPGGQQGAVQRGLFCGKLTSHQQKFLDREKRLMLIPETRLQIQHSTLQRDSLGKVTARMKYTPTELSTSTSHHGNKENTPAAVCNIFLGQCGTSWSSCDYVTRKHRRGKEKFVCILFIFLKNVCGFSPLEKLNQKSHFCLGFG